jgi:hypothetical protein
MRKTLCDPAQNEKRRPDFMPSEDIEQSRGILFNATFIHIPMPPTHGRFKGGHLEMLLNIK